MNDEHGLNLNLKEQEKKKLVDALAMMIYAQNIGANYNAQGGINAHRAKLEAAKSYAAAEIFYAYKSDYQR